MHGKHIIILSLCGEMGSHLRPLVKETNPGEAVRLKWGKEKKIKKKKKKMKKKQKNKGH